MGIPSRYSPKFRKEMDHTKWHSDSHRHKHLKNAHCDNKMKNKIFKITSMVCFSGKCVFGIVWLGTLSQVQFSARSRFFGTMGASLGR
ncbi:hypothetical protein LguiA_002619 [Lonicera macranthoides]